MTNYFVSFPTKLFAIGATKNETGKAIQIPTPNAFSHRFINPSSIPVFTHVKIRDIKNPIAKAIMAAKR